MEPVSTNLWVGSHGKKSLLHFDDYENVLMQVPSPAPTLTPAISGG